MRFFFILSGAARFNTYFQCSAHLAPLLDEFTQCKENQNFILPYELDHVAKTYYEDLFKTYIGAPVNCISDIMDGKL